MESENYRKAAEEWVQAHPELLKQKAADLAAALQEMDRYMAAAVLANLIHKSITSAMGAAQATGAFEDLDIIAAHQALETLIDIDLEAAVEWMFASDPAGQGEHMARFIESLNEEVRRKLLAAVTSSGRTDQDYMIRIFRARQALHKENPNVARNALLGIAQANFDIAYHWAAFVLHYQFQQPDNRQLLARLLLDLDRSTAQRLWTNLYDTLREEVAGELHQLRLELQKLNLKAAQEITEGTD